MRNVLWNPEGQITTRPAPPARRPPPAWRQRAGPGPAPHDAIFPLNPAPPARTLARMLRTSPPCVTEWPRTPRQTLTCLGGAGPRGSRSGAQGCGGERSWAAGRAWPGQRSGDVGRLAANMRFWHIGGEPAVPGGTRGCRAGPAAPRPVPRDPAGPRGCLRPRWAGLGPGFGAASSETTVPTALTAPWPPWFVLWPTRGPCKRASLAASGGCARDRGWGEGWRGRRPGRGTVDPGAGGARNGSVWGGNGAPNLSTPPHPPAAAAAASPLNLHLEGLFGAGLNLSFLCFSPSGGESGSSPRWALQAFSWFSAPKC